VSDVLAGLVSFYSNLPALAGLVDQRVFTGILPQSVLSMLTPVGSGLGAISIYTVGGPDQVSHTGRSSLGRGRFQITCWGQSFTDANTIARAVKASSGRKVDDTLGPILWIGRRDIHEPGQNIYTVACDVAVWNSD
jgi:hypothetical protein